MKIFPLPPKRRQVCFRRDRKPKPGYARVGMRALIGASVFGIFVSPATLALQSDPAKPVVVQPGAPGAASKTLPSSTRATLPPRSPADVEFMQGMILHHAQAVEMTAMIPSHTQNKDLGLLGARISSSQSDEIKFMKRWLAAAGEWFPKASRKCRAWTCRTRLHPRIWHGCPECLRRSKWKRCIGRGVSSLTAYFSWG